MILWRNLDLQRWPLGQEGQRGDVGCGEPESLEQVSKAARKGNPCRTALGRREGLPREEVWRVQRGGEDDAGVAGRAVWAAGRRLASSLGSRGQSHRSEVSVGNARGARGQQAQEATGQG